MLCLFLKEANFFIIHDIKSILQGMQRKKKISNGEKKKEKKKKSQHYSNQIFLSTCHV